MASPESYQHSSRSGQCHFLEIDEDELDTSSLHARIVQSPTREILLHQHTRSLSPSNIDVNAETLLLDLGRLAPSMVKEFIPRTNLENTFPFRLINDVNLQGEEDSYIAMSYCRKNLTQETRRRVVTPIGDLPFGWQKEVEQFPLPTSAPLFGAVIRERRIGEGLWFDQVCIDQEDEAERPAIIGAVDTIYKNARAVVVALDDIIVTPDEEQFLRYYTEQYSYCELPGDQQPNAGQNPPFMQQYGLFRAFLERIISSEFFERAWCTHEMKMGRNHVFLVSCYTQCEDEIHTVIRFTGDFLTHMLVLGRELVTLPPASTSRIRSLLNFFQHQVPSDAIASPTPSTPQSIIPNTTSFVPMVSEIFCMKAGGNPRFPEYLRRLDANRDKTSIALNASGLPLALAPPNPFSRPNIEDECLRTLLLVGIAARDPVSLCTTGTPLQLHDGSVSWLCRPGPLDGNAARPSLPRFHTQTGQIVQATDGRAEYAQLNLIFLDLPHRTQPSASFPTHVVQARVFIDHCVQYQIPGSGLWGFSQAPAHSRTPALRNIFIQTLACVFDCGSQWLSEVSSSIQAQIDPHAIDMLLNPHLLLQNYILLPEGRAALSQLVHFVSTLIASGIPWASGASERTHGPLIISAPTSSSSSSAYSPPPGGSGSSGGKAIIFAPFEHSKTLLIAIPEAVKSTEFAALARGWILTSMNAYTGSSKASVSWTLQSKGVVFGNVSFGSAVQACGDAELRNHRVYGPSGR
ncbi:hypothetical protein BDW02DRAFT_632740 [Decorospora gaudefroyi]|uniref:Heterokaryon incompatibility domain-containing protein n=1 Tax=Decorospora gaudefroyi TaxID=184978 RepID=A0A6A5K400_9PLEO|nr:hypothetical protein BDW02DRAFT_632740 [Decorospora gaudefroyi]